jgi:hypothetical protein
MNDTRKPRGWADNRNSGRYIARFAGQVFEHENNPADGPFHRKLASEVAWKRPPSASIQSELSQ